METIQRLNYKKRKVKKSYLSYVTINVNIQNIPWKKRSEETQTLRAGCSKAEPKKFASPQTPFPGARDGQNLTSWRWSLPLPINQVWWGSMHAISSYCGNRPINKHTNKQTDKRDRLQYTAPQLSAQCKYTIVFRILKKIQNTHQ